MTDQALVVLNFLLSTPARIRASGSLSIPVLSHSSQGSQQTKKKTSRTTEISEGKGDKRTKHQQEEARILSCRQKEQLNIQIGDIKIKQVQHLKYLGSVLIGEAKCSSDIRRHTGISHDAFQNLSELLRNSKILLETTRELA